MQTRSQGAASGGNQPPSLRTKSGPYEPSDRESQAHRFPVNLLLGHNPDKFKREKPTDDELCTWRKTTAATAAAMMPPKGGICNDMHNLAMLAGIDYDDVAVYADRDPEISALASAVLYGDPLDLPTLDEMKMSYTFENDRRQQNTIEVPRLSKRKAAAPLYTSHGCKVFLKPNGGIRIVPAESDSDSDSDSDDD